MNAARWFASVRRTSRKNTTPSRSGKRHLPAPTTFPENQTDSLLFKIGNKEIVSGMAECSEVLQLIDKDDSYDGLYVDLGKKIRGHPRQLFLDRQGRNPKARRTADQDS